MKSYNVKSNAMRFARGLAVKFPGYINDEPVAVSPGAKEWFPAVAAPTKVLAEGIPEEISSTAYVNGRIAEAVVARLAEPVTAYLKGKSTGGEAVKVDMTVAEAATMSVKEVVAKVKKASKAPELRPYQQEVVDAVKAGAVVMSFPAMKAAVADLPLTKSTPAEIAERRAARAAARAAEPKPVKAAKVAKTTRADIIVALVSREGGATSAELMAATEWQAHTLRGYIAGTLRKRGHNIVAKRIKGEETRYMIPPVVAHEDEPEAGEVQA